MTLKIVPDTSVIIEGILSDQIKSKEIKPTQIIIHEAVMAELEAQANRNLEIGFQGLDEIKRLREACGTRIPIAFKGSRPTDFEIRHAKAGEIDSLIRQLAADEGATLITGDKVQALVAESKGISVKLIHFEEKKEKFVLVSYFDKHTMSVHLRENTKAHAKKGRPGAWKYEQIGKENLDRPFMQQLIKDIIRQAKMDEDAFIEVERKGSVIIQYGDFRIITARPPFADGYEVTAVRPVAKLALEDYHLSTRLLERIDSHAEGILIAGAPGNGKSTFAQAMAEHYASKGRIVKTLEAPRDLNVSDSITQYSLTAGSAGEVQDILLLSRPDHVIFDEMRSQDHFRLFSDLRLAGVGMAGVIHGGTTIEAIQRFIGKIELGIIPHIIDTVIFIKEGKVHSVYRVSMAVKVPSGMMEADLARPVVSVTDFETEKTAFEIYTYGEQTMVLPVGLEISTPMRLLAADRIKMEFSRHDVRVELLGEGRCRVYAPASAKKEIIGVGGARIRGIEEKLGISIELATLDEIPTRAHVKAVAFQHAIDKKHITLTVPGAENTDVRIMVNGEALCTAKTSKKGIIHLTRKNAAGKKLVDALNEGTVTVRV
ncbi:MAG: PINc/VapC family ATPase [Nanoarchaeota archaeon]